MKNFFVTLKPKFKLGEVIANIEVLKICNDGDFSLKTVLDRHKSCDWGLVSEPDRLKNNEAIFSGGKIISVYNIDNSFIRVVTEKNHRITIVMLDDKK